MEAVCDRNVERFFGVYERPVRWKREKIAYKERRDVIVSIQKDCFAYRIGGCTIMTETICRRDTCSFYKTKEQAAADREKYGFQKNYRPKGDAR